MYELAMKCLIYTVSRQMGKNIKVIILHYIWIINPAHQQGKLRFHKTLTQIDKEIINWTEQGNEMNSINHIGQMII